MGQRHRAITLSDGTVIFDVLGAEGEDEENDDQDDENDDDLDDDNDPDGDDDDEEDDDDSDSQDKGKNKPSVKTLQTELAQLKAELETKDRRMRRADRAKSKALTELQQLKSGSGKDLADARSEIERLQQELASKSGTDPKSLIRDEFLLSEKYPWQDRKAALRLLDLSEIDVENGKVDKDSFEDAVDQLAKTYPFLVKPAPSRKGKDEDDDKGGDQETRERPSGRQPRSSRRNNRNQIDQQALLKKFPVAAGRS